MSTTRFFIVVCMFVMFSAGCKYKADTCAAGEVVDHRFGGMISSATTGLCVSETPHETVWKTGDACNGIVINKDPDLSKKVAVVGGMVLPGAALVDQAICLSGCTDGNLSEDKSECLSIGDINEKCNILGDCQNKKAVCLSDPTVLDELVSQFALMAKFDESLKQSLAALKQTEVTRTLVRDVIGFNFCTILDCDVAGNECPEGFECKDIAEGSALLKSQGGTVGKKVCLAKTPASDTTPAADTAVQPDTAVEPDTAVTTDELVSDELMPDDAPITPACMGDPCAAHADCKKEGCVATFCTKPLTAVKPGIPEVCVLRCDPANSNTDCPEGMTCTDVSMAGGFGIDIDGAKGICATATLAAAMKKK